MTGSTQPMPGSEFPEELEWREGLGAVEAAAAAVALPSSPSLLRLRAVLGEMRDCPTLELDPDAVPPPDPPVGWLPPTPGTLSLYWSTPELPGGTVCAAAAAGRAIAIKSKVMAIPRTPVHTDEPAGG
jgi:hypothetical protein